MMEKLWILLWISSRQQIENTTVSSAENNSNGTVLALKVLFSTQALLKSRRAYVDTQNYPECIIDIIVMFLSPRQPKSILGSSHLMLGQRK